MYPPLESLSRQGGRVKGEDKLVSCYHGVMLSDSETSHNSWCYQMGDPSHTLRMTLLKCVALARQNARSDRVCLDFFFGYFLLIKQKKVTITIK